MYSGTIRSDYERAAKTQDKFLYYQVVLLENQYTGTICVSVVRSTAAVLFCHLVVQVALCLPTNAYVFGS